ncbi:hypothetical protein CHITON_1361 [Thermococcus chitonophagus]|uniref:Uncharacterized protein n=1 Tax=Thermococcus chitonophagus TaxID=54262 RepID=A0A160VTA8_9EURY|nr:hypothetical protein CHITON_1361 [Thermococcus chitonophagus]
MVIVVLLLFLPIVSVTYTTTVPRQRKFLNPTKSLSRRAGFFCMISQR